MTKYMVYVVYPDGDTIPYDYEEFDSYQECRERAEEIRSENQFNSLNYTVDIVY